MLQIHKRDDTCSLFKNLQMKEWEETSHEEGEEEEELKSTQQNKMDIKKHDERETEKRSEKNHVEKSKARLIQSQPRNNVNFMSPFQVI